MLLPEAYIDLAICADDIRQMSRGGRYVIVSAKSKAKINQLEHDHPLCNTCGRCILCNCQCGTPVQLVRIPYKRGTANGQHREHRDM